MENSDSVDQAESFLQTYFKETWQDINNSLSYRKLIEQLQDRFGVDADGKLGPRTAQAILKEENRATLISLLEKVRQTYASETGGHVQNANTPDTSPKNKNAIKRQKLREKSTADIASEGVSSSIHEDISSAVQEDISSAVQEDLSSAVQTASAPDRQETLRTTQHVKANTDTPPVPDVFLKAMSAKGYTLIDNAQPALPASLAPTKNTAQSVVVALGEKHINEWLHRIHASSSLREQVNTLTPQTITAAIFVSVDDDSHTGSAEFQAYCDKQDLHALRLIQSPKQPDTLDMEFVRPQQAVITINGTDKVIDFERYYLDSYRQAIFSEQQRTLIDSLLAKETTLGEFSANNPSFSGFFSDGIERSDSLDVTNEVKALCSIIASRDVCPPLSIGLFGDWGTGKSFFIKEMNNCLTEITRQSREVEQSREQGQNVQEPDYWSNIAQISFNAWHYEDTDLWSSLVVRIFDALNEHIVSGVPDEKKSKELKAFYSEIESLNQELVKSKNSVNKAQAEHLAAKTSVNEQTERLNKAQQAATAPNPTHIAAEVFAQLKTEYKVLEPALADLGLSDIIDDAEKIKQQTYTLIESTRFSGNKLKALIKYANKPSTVALVCLLALTLLLLPVALEQMHLGSMHNLLTQVLASAIGGLGVLHKIQAGLDRTIAHLTRFVGQLNSRSDQAIHEQQNRYNKAVQALEQYEQNLANANAHYNKTTANLARAKAELESVETGKLLQQFLNQQQDSEYYRKNLGVVSSIREDFSNLSHILDEQSQAKRMRWKKDSVQTPQNITKARFADVDRIVLYVDDLDRCSPERVVEVLRAVHLLLAFKLFVVVVAVDSRWLLNSLKLSVETFNPDIEPSVQDTEDGILNSNLNSSLISTPQNYLEKIFQIPYSLKPISSTGMAKLLEQLTEPVDIGSTQAAQKETQGAVLNADSNPPKTRHQHTETSPEASPKPTPEVSINQSAIKPPITNKTKDNLSGAKAAQPASATSTIHSGTSPNHKQQPAKPDDIVKDSTNAYTSIEMHSDRHHMAPFELQAMQLAWGSLTTPRAVNRLVNTYRFIRSMVSEDNQQAFFNAESGDYHCVIFLLIIVIGYPIEAESILKEIHQADNTEQLLAPLNRITLIDIHQQNLEKLRDALQAHPFYAAASIRQLKPWLSRVARFSFRPIKL